MPSKLFRYWWLTLIAQLPFIKSSPTSSFCLAKPFSVLNFRKKLENASSSGPFYSPKGWLFCMKRCHLHCVFASLLHTITQQPKIAIPAGTKRIWREILALLQSVTFDFHGIRVSSQSIHINAPQGLPKFPYHTRYQFLKSCWKLASNSLNNHLS